MPNKILIPLQSLIFCFPEAPENRQAAVGPIEGLWRGYSLVCPKGAICWAPVVVTQASGGSSVLNLLCAKDQANENWAQVRYLADFPAGYEGDSLARFSHSFFLLVFISSLHLCNCLQNIGQVIIFQLLKVVFETDYLRLGLKSTWQGLCYA